MEKGDFHESASAAGVWRGLDAAANRAGEALRVVEDTLRFVLDDPFLTQAAKQLRHDLAAILARADLPLRVTMRDVHGDVGAGSRAEAALGRHTPADIIAANAARGAQALRTLQEYAAMIAADAADHFERLRYRLYTLERAAVGGARSADRLAGVSLCVLVDGRGDSHGFSSFVASLFEAGVRMIQIRDKHLAVSGLVDRTRLALEAARRHSHDAGVPRPIVIVNDRVDIAAALEADGVHIGEDDLPTPLVRRVIGPRGMVGRTAHTLAEAEAAVLDGADYLGVGPCYPSTTKTFDSFAPPDFLRSVGLTVGLPAFAIGGVTIDRLDALAAMGIRRAAVASAVTAAANPPQAARDLIERLESLSTRERHP